MRGLTIAAAMALSPMALHAAAPVADPAEAAIRAAMVASAAGWDAGDLDRFMAIYAPDAIFVTGKALIHGKAAIADNYRKSFTGGAKTESGMTTLVFERRADGWKIVADHSS